MDSQAPHLTSLSKKVLSQLMDGEKYSAPELTEKLGGICTSSGASYAMKRLQSQKLVTVKKVTRIISGKNIRVLEYSISPKGKLIELDDAEAETPTISVVPEIRKIIESLLHNIDRIREIEKLIVTPKQRAIIAAVEKAGLKFKNYA